MERVTVKDTKDGDTYIVEPHETRSSKPRAFHDTLLRIKGQKNNFKIMWLWNSAYNWYYETVAKKVFHPTEVNEEMYRNESMILLVSHLLSYI